jgi:hypothetical protein
MLDVRYDPASREAFVRLRQGRSQRTRRLSDQATAEYDSRRRLLTISVTDIDPAAVDFLRTSDEETLLRVIAAQAGASKAGSGLYAPRPEAGNRPKPQPKPKPRRRAGPKKG